MKRWALEGIVAVAIPTLGYTLAFAYEVGFCSTFAIPLELIKVELSSILLASLGVLGVLGFIFNISNLFLMVSQPKSVGPISWGLLRISPFLAIWLALMFIYRELWQMWIWSAGFVALYAFLHFGLPLLLHEARSRLARKREHQEEPKTPPFESPPTQNQKMTYREKLETEDRYDAQTKDISDYLGNPLRIGFLALGIALFLFLISYCVGNTVAIRKADYLIPSTHENSVVMRIYGNNAVCTKVVRETGEVNKNFFIIDISSDPSTVFQLEKIGPLKLSRMQAK